MAEDNEKGDMLKNKYQKNIEKNALDAMREKHAEYENKGGMIYDKHLENIEREVLKKAKKIKETGIFIS